jgi:hypothetical protein
MSLLIYSQHGANGRYQEPEKDVHHWVYIEFASRRAHGNNHAKRVGAVDARRDFFLAVYASLRCAPLIQSNFLCLRCRFCVLLNDYLV